MNKDTTKMTGYIFGILKVFSRGKARLRIRLDDVSYQLEDGRVGALSEMKTVTATDHAIINKLLGQYDEGDIITLEIDMLNRISSISDEHIFYQLPNWRTDIRKNPVSVERFDILDRLAREEEIVYTKKDGENAGVVSSWEDGIEVSGVDLRILVEYGYIVLTRSGHQYELTDKGHEALFDRAVQAAPLLESRACTLQSLNLKPEEMQKALKVIQAAETAFDIILAHDCDPNSWISVKTRNHKRSGDLELLFSIWIDGSEKISDKTLEQLVEEVSKHCDECRRGLNERLSQHYDTESNE